MGAPRPTLEDCRHDLGRTLPRTPLMGGTAVKVRGTAMVAVLVLSSGLALSACGSNPSAANHAKIVKAACVKIAAVLSDGPDPTADPVGYAEAQVLPLSKIKVRDAVLQNAIHYLDVEYKLFYQTDGAPATSKAVKAALKIIDVYCPGVGS
jgi:hypothetical protein